MNIRFPKKFSNTRTAIKTKKNLKKDLDEADYAGKLFFCFVCLFLVYRIKSKNIIFIHVFVFSGTYSPEDLRRPYKNKRKNF